MKIENPYQNLTDGEWLRGNLHMHPRPREDKQQAIDEYANAGYDFVMLTEHDIYFSPEEVEALDARGLILIPGNEISANGPHLLHVNAQSLIEPDEDRQKVIDAVNAEGSFAIINHPRRGQAFNRMPLKGMLELHDYLGMEIFNGGSQGGVGSAYGTGLWDELLNEGRRIWGHATDDYHRPPHLGQGWDMVYAAERSVSGVVEAIRQGRFYASTGVIIRSVEVIGEDRIRIETENAERISALRQGGRRTDLADDTVLETQVTEGSEYVRFECWGHGESFAWSQPLWIA
ncbi:MAG: CehA/McbA family metallohydrolase [Planctomycetota bacterium]|jgi:hypothetical protein|nr:CehA/McbA family metallohydrolase [Planctomycetota bacterium]